MPLYEYVCTDCKTRFDTLRSIKAADDPIACHHCQSEHTTRAITKCFAHSEGRVVAQSTSGCAGCGGGSCASCGH